MSRFDQPHDHAPSQGDPLDALLRDVAIPDGLEARLLAACNAPTPHETSVNIPRNDSWSRRRWLAAGVAAGVGSMIAGGTYAWTCRPLAKQEVIDKINTSLVTTNWVKWSPFPATVTKTAFPPALRRSIGWQIRDLNVGTTVAHNMSLPGCPKAVLFATRTTRDISAFPTTPPLGGSLAKQTGIWSHVAIWRSASGNDLYVLAIQSDDVKVNRDYSRLFRRGPAIPLA